MNDVKTLLKDLKRKGAEIKLTGGNHYAVHNPCNGVTVYLPKTPSDWRWRLQFKAKLKRLGLQEV